MKSLFLYQSDVLTVARVIVPRNSDRWGSTAATFSGPEIAFPRLPVVNELDGYGSLLREPTSVNLINAHTEFHRRRVHPDGVFTDWFAMPVQVWSGLLATFDPEQSEKAEQAGRPFRFPQGPLPANVQAQQRALSSYLESVSALNVDPLFVEETAFEIAGRSLEAAYQSWAQGHSLPPIRPTTAETHRDAVERAKELLATRSHERLSLEDVGHAVCLSPLHFARVFKRLTGRTLHQYLTDLRSRAVFDHLCRHRWDLTDLALETGFCNRSHLSRTCRQEFGLTPREIRSTFASGDSRVLREFLERIRN